MEKLGTVNGPEEGAMEAARAAEIAPEPGPNNDSKN